MTTRENPTAPAGHIMKATPARAEGLPDKPRLTPAWVACAYSLERILARNPSDIHSLHVTLFSSQLFCHVD